MTTGGFTQPLTSESQGISQAVRKLAWTPKVIQRKKNPMFMLELCDGFPSSTGNFYFFYFCGFEIRDQIRNTS